MTAPTPLQQTEVSEIHSATLERLRGRLSGAPNPIQRVLRGDVTQRFGCFLVIRKLYSLFQNLRQRLNSEHYRQRLGVRSHSIFSDINLRTCIKEIRQDSVSFGLKLPHAIVQEILQYSTDTLYAEPGYDKAFRVTDIRNGFLPDGHQVIRALAVDVMSCKAIVAIIQDPLLLQLAHDYLRYYPAQVTGHLSWSIANQLPEGEIRKQYPPTTFHYDIAGYNFATAYFYITPVLNEHCGPHVMIKGSHQRKPLRMLFSSGRHSDQAVYREYGMENEIQIMGEAGFGFFQDPSCFHKVKSPTQQNRLLLQVRYS